MRRSTPSHCGPRLPLTPPYVAICPCARRLVAQRSRTSPAKDSALNILPPEVLRRIGNEYSTYMKRVRKGIKGSRRLKSGHLLEHRGLVARHVADCSRDGVPR